MADDKELGSVGSDPATEPTRGVIAVRIGWGTDAQGNILSPPNIGQHLQIADHTIRQQQLDPNDPMNAEIFDLIQVNKRENLNESDAICWMSEEQLDSNVRFQLLRQRADGVKPFSHLAMIPSRVAEIPMHLQAEASSLSSRAAAANAVEEEELTVENPLERLRRKGQRNLIRMQKKVAERLISAESTGRNKKLQLSDLVVEDHIPDIT